MTFALAVGLGAAPQLAAQVNPPYITIPSSGVASGDVVTLSGANFTPGAVVVVKLTSPTSASWSQSVGVGADGKISYPIQFSAEGMYKVEILGSDGRPLTSLVVSSARQR